MGERINKLISDYSSLASRAADLVKTLNAIVAIDAWDTDALPSSPEDRNYTQAVQMLEQFPDKLGTMHSELDLAVDKFNDAVDLLKTVSRDAHRRHAGPREKKETRQYPSCCTAYNCGEATCEGCPNKPILDEFKQWKAETHAVREDPIWSPTFWTGIRKAQLHREVPLLDSAADELGIGEDLDEEYEEQDLVEGIRSVRDKYMQRHRERNKDNPFFKQRGQRWYDCPKCGKPDSSDGEHFCGKCEEEYQREQMERDEEEYKRYRESIPEWYDGVIPGFWEWRRGGSLRKAADELDTAHAMRRAKLLLNTISLEDWAPRQPDERWCEVEIVSRHIGENAIERLQVRVLEGPEKGRIVTGLTRGNLREVADEDMS